MSYAHAPYVVLDSAPSHQDCDEHYACQAFIHDPYSFAGYITLKDEPQYSYCRRLSFMSSECGTPNTDCSLSSTADTTDSPPSTPPPSDAVETSSEDADHSVAPAEGNRRRRVRYVRGPCGHKNSKRLRFKNGQGQYICLECNLKWRSAFDEQM